LGTLGAGKSTLINTLTRFYDIHRGSVLLDGIDIRKMDKRDLRKYISIVLQDVYLFSGSIKSNINMDNPEIGMNKIIDAAKTVGADKFISNLPNKYEEEVKERGATLSVGQKQLISFARALAYDPKILILDEATSSLDSESEQLVQEALDNLMKGRTSFVIAHRLSTIRNADKIVLIDKGIVSEAGTHNELMSHNGLYRKLNEMQFEFGVVTQSPPAE
jgi:ATP-binding cassette subfamily B protein